MNKSSYAKLITSAFLFLFLIILLLAFQGGSRGDDHQYVHVAIGTKDISTGRKLKYLKPQTESLTLINTPKKKDGFHEYSDQKSYHLSERDVFVDLMARDYRGPKSRKPPIHN
ncbi:PREDICTED: root meristem growth factor 7-like [Camelina sativa]|uniref:Root meristem growth factor 7-like n=1 Tax=Camelina sativa TaxID=90675 RepID=A0ABM0VZJ7_CAMSA|nr:PREDICTED: root meristem growth factor 7-like [Camelina sativa]